jgi:mono/diheme cytochrome c family protein
MKWWVVTASIGAASLFMWATPGHAAGGDALFKKSCTGCHYTDGPAKEKTIADQLAKQGPELWYAGSKFKKDWLVAWLQDPQPIRPLKYNSLSEDNPRNHPKLSVGDAVAITDFLMGLTSPEVSAGAIEPKVSARGKYVFAKKAPCVGCHEHREGGRVRGGKSGPSLVGAAKRLNPDWIYAYLSDINTFKPVRDMPDFGGFLNPAYLKSVAAYVATFE